MSWISDVQEEVKGLDTSEKRLRQFGITVGAVFLALTLWMFLKQYPILFQYLLGIIGILLMVIGISCSSVLRRIYKVWMGIAFAMGWIVSRILLVIIFYLVLTPIGLTARLFGKDFLDIRVKKVQDSHWIKRDREKAVNYEKMY